MKLSLKYTNALVFTILLLVYSYVHHQKQDVKAQIETMDLLNSLSKIVVATQKTRGLTNTYLNGDIAAKLLINGELDTIYATLASLEEHHFYTTSQHIQEDIQTVANDIEALVTAKYTTTSAVLFKAYTTRINTLLYLSKAISYEHFQNIPSITVLQDTLLPLTETIGKLRGLGSGVVARKEIQPLEVPQLKSFIVQSQQLLEVLKTSKAVPSNFTQQKDEITNSVSNYTQRSKNVLFSSHPGTIDAIKYFSQGTKTISNIMALFTKLHNHHTKSFTNTYANLVLANNIIAAVLVFLAFFTSFLVIKEVMEKSNYG